MKLHILSDLHLGVQGMEIANTDADLVILAGDIARPAAAVEWALGFQQQVLYVPGNHEFYGSSLPGVLRQLRQLCAGTHVHLLDNDAFELGGIRFLGSTLWTDFLAAGAGELQQAALAEAQRFMFDFRKVTVDEAENAQTLTPEHTTALFADNAHWLDETLAKPYAGTTVVITHHAPSTRSIHPRYAGSLLNAGFVSDAEWLLQGGRAKLWVHGHVHHCCDYLVDQTRVLCNPRGYIKGEKVENPGFDPYLVVEIA